MKYNILASYFFLQKIYKSFFFIVLWVGISASIAAVDIQHDISSGNLVINGSDGEGGANRNYIVQGSTTTNTIRVNSGYKGTITLKEVNITTSYVLNKSCITVLGSETTSNLAPVTKVKIVLDGTNTLTYNGASSSRPIEYCAFQVNRGAQIEISSIDPNDNTKGVLNANSGAGGTTYGQQTNGGAGIGARSFSASSYANEGTGTITCTSGSTINNKVAGGNILISSGTVTAVGGLHAAGIGGGHFAFYDGIILIYGGIVTSTAGSHAAGIGSGCPDAKGVVACSGSVSSIIALPPAQITAKGSSNAVTIGNNASLGLTGANQITYVGDANKPQITVRTEENDPDANIYLDLTETSGLSAIFTSLGLYYDPAKAKMGQTDTSGFFVFNGLFEQPTTFFTDAVSSKQRPYIPVKKTVTSEQTIVLPLLDMKIALEDRLSTPLEVGYTEAEALQSAYRLEIEYEDDTPMTGVEFSLQTSVDFSAIKFYDSDNTTSITAPIALRKGDICYLYIPIKQGKDMGIYSDVLQIRGTWKGVPLTAPIRKIATQRVVYDDSNTNKYIKVTTTDPTFKLIYPTTRSINLKLNIDHAELSETYNASDVTAKYLITTEPNFNEALKITPLNKWVNMTIPNAKAQDAATSVSFSGKPRGVYYIHWYVTSGIVYAHSLTVSNPPAQYGGFGRYIITDILTAGELKGNPYVCEDNIPQTIKGEASTGGSGEFSYQWQMSINNGSTWTNVGTDNLNYTPPGLTVSPTHFRRTTTDKLYGDQIQSLVFRISLVTNSNQMMYWKRTATNHNWNDPSNWVDAKGTALNRVPLSCSKVYISGDAVNYPSLKPEDTPTDIYGLPVCDEITFAYGAELAYQHNLTYNKAHVQYNFGQYDSEYKLITSSDPYNPNVMKRDQWYIVAAPLKSMASGDFSMAGYPFSWQAGHNKMGLVVAETVTLDASRFPANDVNLSDNYNSLALKVAKYENSAVGYKDHRNLQGLKGIIEIPYFETLPNEYLPGQSYNRLNKTNTFYYFDAKTLQQLPSPIGKMKRGNEAFRFVYENDNNEADLISGIKVYKLLVTAPGTDNKVLIGNPLLASIDMYKFLQVNKSSVDESASYQVYNSNSQTWTTYSYMPGNKVKSFESFIITLRDTSAELIFPLDGEYALTGSSSQPTRDAFVHSMHLTLLDTQGNGGEPAILTSLASSNISKLVSLDKGSSPEVFFVDESLDSKNQLQRYNTGQQKVNIGVKIPANVQEVTLKFDNLDEFVATHGVHPKLIDRSTGIICDLTKNNKYTFVNSTKNTDTKDHQIDTERFYLSFTNVSEIEEAEPIKINYSDGNLSVISGDRLSSVKVYSVAGQLIIKDKVAVGQNLYQKRITFTPGVYVVEAETVDKTKKQEKIVVK